jgi:hypothetical protein
MTGFSAGQIVGGSEGFVHLKLMNREYCIFPEDLGRLFFVGASIPIYVRGERVIRGDARLNASGRSVVIGIGGRKYMIPRDRFLAVAMGEDISCIVFEIPSDEMFEKHACREQGEGPEPGSHDTDAAATDALDLHEEAGAA